MSQYNWDAIRAHYVLHDEAIMRMPANEWGIDPYSWDTGLLRMTPIEEALWEDIRDANAVLYPQYPVGRFFVDFANPVARVAIECDGAAYHKDKAKDESRDRVLNALGWSVYRISGRACKTVYDFEADEEGAAQRFISMIVKHHGISRNSQTHDTGWASSEDMVQKMLQFLEENRGYSALFESEPA